MTLIAEIPPPRDGGRRDGAQLLADDRRAAVRAGGRSAHRRPQDPVSVPPDDKPSLQFYADHFHCFGCGEHGDRLDWLTRGEGLTHEEAIALIQDWDGPAYARSVRRGEQNRPRARTVGPGIPIAGTLAERYLAETRHIDVSRLPGNISDSLRFLARCPFGSGPASAVLARAHARSGERPADRHPAYRLEIRDGQGLQARPHRPWPHRRGEDCGRRGRSWSSAKASRPRSRPPPASHIAARRCSRRGRRSRAADSAGFPVLPGVERLIILVDHDSNGEGQAAAVRCMERWTRAGRTVVRLTPKRVDADFNDLVMPEPVS